MNGMFSVYNIKRNFKSSFVHLAVLLQCFFIHISSLPLFVIVGISSTNIDPVVPVLCTLVVLDPSSLPFINFDFNYVLLV